LKNTGGGADHLAEGRAADVAVHRLRPVELGVVEDVKASARKSNDFDSVNGRLLAIAMS
jgi:hypothetical protein